jgi:hypothetical protein
MMNLDSWTKAYLGENPKAPQTLNATPRSNSKFTYATATSPRAIPFLSILRDSRISAI